MTNPGSAAVEDAVKQLESLTLSSEAAQGSSSGACKKVETVIDWNLTSQLAQRCADSLRTEQARTILGKTPIIQACSNLLQLSASSAPVFDVLPAQTQLCRIIGNLVLDHPANRQTCLSAQVPQCILQALGSIHAETQSSNSLAHVQAIKACTGALLNLSIDTSQIATLLYELKALDILSSSLDLYTVSSWTTGNISDENDIVTRALTVEWTLNLMKEILSTEGSTLSLLAEKLAKTVLAPSFHPSSTSEPPAQGTPSPSSAYTLLSADLSIISTASDLLESRAYDDAAIQEALAFSTNISNKTLLERMTVLVEAGEMPAAWQPIIQEDRAEGEDSLEAERTFATFKAEVARIVIAVCSNDKVMQESFSPTSSLQWLLPLCKRWLQSTRSDLVITSSTMLANLARRDDHCVTLVHNLELAPVLAQIVQEYTRLPGEPTQRSPDVAQVLYGVVGLTKNLAIASANKQTLCDAGLVEPCLALLGRSLDMIVPLQNAAIGVLKHLCAGNISSSLKVVLPPTIPGASSIVTLQPTASTNGDTSQASPLNDVLALIARTNDVRLKCEATRLLVNVVRSLYSARSISSPVTPSALDGLEMGIAKQKARKIIEDNAQIFDAISEMVRTGEKYPTLVNEGIVALVLLSTTDVGAQSILRTMTKRYAPAQTAEDAAADVNGPVLLSNADPRGVHGATKQRVTSRAVSLNPKNAPASSMDVIVKWMNNYAIAAQDMPAELAGNALSLVEGLSRIPNSREALPSTEIRACLQGIAQREAHTPAEQVLREVAKRNFQRFSAE